MTNEELRVKAWEAQGWHSIGIINGVECWQKSESGWVDGMSTVSWGNVSNAMLKDIPDYPNEISDAWKLVEKMQEMELYPNIENVGIHGALWNVWLMLTGNTSEDIVSQDENVKRAITMAFIVAMEKK